MSASAVSHALKSFEDRAGVRLVKMPDWAGGIMTSPCNDINI
ncbi:LysR family transcriptional regulator [Sphingomonas sp. Leaf339]|nr:LysR family transcriptional regulator [Sphingomonas sp. Leaf339]